MNIRKGNMLDLLEAGAFEYGMHGCNCFHAMGGGIAGEIARRYPVVPAVDKKMTAHGDPRKLSTFTSAKVTSKAVILPAKGIPWSDKYEMPLAPSVTYEEYPLENHFTLINLYTQFTPGPDFIPSIFPTAIRGINSNFKGKTIGIPLLGCGIGGGDWLKVMNDLLIHGPDVNWEVCVL